MTTFTKGQTVLRAPGFRSYHIPSGDEFTVAAARLDARGDQWLTLEGHGGIEFLAECFEPVENTPALLDPSQKARVEIADWDDFQEFDVVVQMPSLEGGPFVVERHQPAPEPEPEESDFHRGFRLGYDNGYTNGRIQASADDSGETSEDTPEPLDPAKVRVGATVTVTVDDDSIGSYAVTGEVRGHLGGTWSVGPINVASNGTWHEGVTLTAHQPAPEPEPEWRPGTFAEIEVFGDTELRALSGGTRGEWHTESGDTYRQPEEVTDVRPLVVIDPAKVDVDALIRDAQKEYGNTPWGSDANRKAVLTVLKHLGLEEA